MVQYQKVDSDYPTSIAEHADGLQEQLIWPSGGPAGPPWRRQVRLAWWAPWDTLRPFIIPRLPE